MRIKAVGVYEVDDYRPVEVFTSKNKALTYMDINSRLDVFKELYAEFFYYLTTEQVQRLSYTQARDFENAMRFAIEETNREIYQTSR